MIKAFLERNMRHGEWNVYIITESEDSRIAHGQPIVFIDSTPETIGMLQSPTLTFKPDDMQDLIDQMWVAGIRPSSTSSAADLIEAKDKHIDDLRESHKAMIAILGRII